MQLSSVTVSFNEFQSNLKCVSMSSNRDQLRHAYDATHVRGSVPLSMGAIIPQLLEPMFSNDRALMLHDFPMFQPMFQTSYFMYFQCSNPCYQPFTPNMGLSYPSQNPCQRDGRFTPNIGLSYRNTCFTIPMSSP